METFLLGILPDLLKENTGLLLALTGTHWVASVITAVTKTRKSKWYKVIELLAFVWGKAKEKHYAEK